MNNILIYIFHFIYRIRLWLILCPTLVAALIYVATMNISRAYEVKMTLYTGVASGYGLDNTSEAKQDWHSVNNAMDNIVNIVKSKTTLKNVSMRLYTQHMLYGNPNADNNYIMSSNYRAINSRTPEDVKKLIDKGSEQKTIENLLKYEKASPSNFVYGLFNWTHRHYSYEGLSKITIKRLGNSDMIDIGYATDDPGIAYNTLLLLHEEFIKYYDTIRFGETNDVIAYFERELTRIGRQLRSAEDSLTDYSIANQVINYGEQTKFIAAMSRDFELRYEDILLAYRSSTDMIAQLESRISEYANNMRNNSLFVSELNKLASLSAKVASMESFNTDSLNNDGRTATNMRQMMSEAEKRISALADPISQHKYTKEGITNSSTIDRWIAELIRNTKAKAEMEVMNNRKKLLDEQYVKMSPVGSTLKRKEREINFAESSYLSILNSLNAARLRLKNLQMTSATLKVINQPIFPIAAMPTKRKMMVFGGFFGALVFVLGTFIIIELLDRTLRDKIRTERITGGKVIGAMPSTSRMQRPFAKNRIRIAVNYICNNLLNYISSSKHSIINIISSEDGEGKIFLAEQMANHWAEIGVRVKVAVYDRDFNPNSREYYMASSIKDIFNAEDADIVIMVYPPLNTINIPPSLLQEANVNLMTVRATRVWKDSDQIIYNNIISHQGNTPLYLYLTKADLLTVETFTGLLPPFSPFRKLGYKIYQMGLTASNK